MKLLVLAQTPPPVHGQSLMVQTLLDALPDSAPQLEVHHVNLPLSRDTADIGRLRAGKVLPLLRAAIAVWRLRWRHGRLTLYYVPAPAKRSALLRDWLLLTLCRPCAERLVLHWHATGLGHWLNTDARPWERTLTRRTLGRADLALVLGEALRADATLLHPLRTVVLRNGIADPCPDWQPRPPRTDPLRVLFIGACSRAKGVFTALDGVAEAHRRRPGSVSLTLAGEFPDAATADAFHTASRAVEGLPVDHVGFLSDDAKHNLFAFADMLLFPTRYEHEAHPLVVIEALAHDLPVIVSRWRAVAENLPPTHSHVIEPIDMAPATIADALARVAAAPRPDGAVRRHYLAHYTRERFAAEFAAALA